MNNGRRKAGAESPFLTQKQVLDIIPFSRGTLYSMIARGDFPKQIKIGERSVVWSKDAVNLWVADKLK